MSDDFEAAPTAHRDQMKTESRHTSDIEHDALYKPVIANFDTLCRESETRMGRARILFYTLSG